MRPAALLVVVATALGAVPARAQDTATGEALAPKVAVVVAGDPDAELSAAASALDTALRDSSEVRVPTDAALRGALRGEGAGGPAPDDGLERVRQERHRLGWEEDRDAPVLARLGRVAGAVALVVVGRGEDGVQAVVFDVRAAAYYEGDLALDASTDLAHRLHFVASRARAAAARPADAASPAAAARAAGAPAETAAPEAASGESEQEQPEPDRPGLRGWLRRNWAYVVGGALLAAVLTAFIVRRQTNEAPQPVLRFVPGRR